MKQKYQIALLDGKGNVFKRFFTWRETREQAILFAIKAKKVFRAYDYIVVTWFD